MLDPTTPEGLTGILAIVRRAAHTAGAHARTGFRQQLTVEHKGAIEVVTRYDRETENILRHELGAGLPHIPIIGEEGGGPDGMTATTPPVALWVDPIDGTTNFVHGHPFWCVSVGLALGEAPVLGVVFAPALATEWFAWTLGDSAMAGLAPPSAVALRRASETTLPFFGAGDLPEARVVETPCRVSATAKLDEALVATGFPYDRRTSAENNFDAFLAIKQRCRGSAAAARRRSISASSPTAPTTATGSESCGPGTSRRASRSSGPPAVW